MVKFNKKVLSILGEYVSVLWGIFPLSVGGLLLSVMLLLVWFYEVKAHANQVLFAICASVGFVLALLCLVTVVTLFLVYWRCVRHNSGIELVGDYEAEGEVRTGVELLVPFFLPFVEVKYIWRSPEDIEGFWSGYGLWRKEWILRRSRGHVECLSRWIVVGDIFGLCEMRLPYSHRCSLTFKPPSAVIDRVSVIRESSGDGYSHPEGKAVGEMVEMRHYQVGDPLRFVLWKVFARSRELLVRRPEEAIVEQRNALIYMISGEDDDDSATLGRAFLELSEFSSGDLMFGADGGGRVVSEKSQGMEDLVHSVDYRQDGGGGLGRLLSEVSQERLDNCYILVPRSSGIWLERLRHFVGALKVKPVLLLGVDGSFLEEVNRSRAHRFFFGENESVRSHVSAFKQLCKELESLGELRVVHRSSGEVIGRDKLEVIQRI